MYYDLGFNDWVFEIDNTTGEEISNRLFKIYKDYPAALQTLKESIKKVNERYDVAFSVMKSQDALFA